MAPKLIDPAILPFYGLATFYLLSQQTSGILTSNPIIQALLKIAPIYFLLAYLKIFRPGIASKIAKSKTINGKPSAFSGLEKSYKDYISLGLAISSIGDICMTQKALYIPGGMIFGVAHILYVFAFRIRGTKAKYAYIITPLAFVSLYTVTTQVYTNIILFILVFMYNTMISATVISALCCHENNRKSSTLYAAIGATFFGISDYIIAVDLLVTSLPQSHNIVVMVTYYTAQLFIALSVNE